MPLLYDNLVLPGLVAAIVTLVIEYTAKPWLEARKERILERYRGEMALYHARNELSERLWPLYRLGEPWDVHRTPDEVEAALVAASGMQSALTTARGAVPTNVLGATRSLVLDIHSSLVQTRELFKAGPTLEDIGGPGGELRDRITQMDIALRRVSVYLDILRWRKLKRRQANHQAREWLAP
ncbi:hypothetical protein BH24ACT15_BH24ACT15_05310 [soil metagenome]